MMIGAAYVAKKPDTNGYFVIDSFDSLFNLAGMNFLELIKQARALGMHEPVFPLENLPGHAC